MVDEVEKAPQTSNVNHELTNYFLVVFLIRKQGKVTKTGPQ